MLLLPLTLMKPNKSNKPKPREYNSNIYTKPNANKNTIETTNNHPKQNIFNPMFPNSQE